MTSREKKKKAGEVLQQVQHDQATEKLQQDPALAEAEEQTGASALEKGRDNDSKSVDDLLADLEKMTQEKDELHDRVMRKQADLDNLRRIAKKEQAEAREYALYDFLSKVLPVLDNLERAILAAEQEKVPAAYVEGLKMIGKQLNDLLLSEGVSLIEARGKLFDPHCHHAVMQVDDEEAESGMVLEEMQKGYRHHQRVLRPAMVKVCS